MVGLDKAWPNLRTKNLRLGLTGFFFFLIVGLLFKWSGRAKPKPEPDPLASALESSIVVTGVFHATTSTQIKPYFMLGFISQCEE